MDTPFKGTAPGYFPYIVIKDETPPPDARLERKSTVLRKTKARWNFFLNELIVILKLQLSFKT